MNLDYSTSQNFGVYALVFTLGSEIKIYIGSTARSFERRRYEHFKQLKQGQHNNSYMQNLWDKYGAPEFIILEICEDPNSVIHCEQKWIDKVGPAKLINLGPAFPSPNFGRRYITGPRSLATRKRMSQAAFRRYQSPESREQTSQTNKKQWSVPEIREKRIRAMSGHKLTDETKAKISQSKIGKKGFPKSQETREKLSLAARERYQLTENREKTALSLKGKPKSLEHRKNLSIAQSKRWAKSRGENENV